ncbi:MAG: 6-phosphofructokinase, partial [Odoribacter sp.]|nr:6-phosphofructokinase [Odoribacter sp.]
DAPGMNACIRAVVRTGIYYQLEVVGIYSGYEGLMNAEFERMCSHSVANIIQRGGTILRSARSERFKTPEGMQLAFDNLKNEGIDALVVIGGDGSFRGADILAEKYNFPVVGAPGTIDNDLLGTDFTIGYDTAINTVIDAVDKIRDTASSHSRLFFIEVMGRDAGFIALRSGIAVGAEAILVPETVTYIPELIEKLEFGRRKNKTSGIIIVAEGDDAGGAFEVAAKVKEKFNYYDTRVSILGHMQRGGSPTCMDRVLASTMGFEAVKALMNGERSVMIGILNKNVVYTPFAKAVKHNIEIDSELLNMANVLSL